MRSQTSRVEVGQRISLFQTRWLVASKTFRLSPVEVDAHTLSGLIYVRTCAQHVVVPSISLLLVSRSCYGVRHVLPGPALFRVGKRRVVSAVGSHSRVVLPPFPWNMVLLMFFEDGKVPCRARRISSDGMPLLRRKFRDHHFEREKNAKSGNPENSLGREFGVRLIR